MALLSTTVLADDTSPVVVTVGEQSVTLARIATELSRLGATEQREFGPTPGKVALAFVDRVVVPRLLLAESARQRLATPLGAEVEALATATLRDIERRVVTPAPERVAQYYAEHIHEFRHPRALKLWRILVSDVELARRIISEARGATGPEKWRLAAREHSLDDATKYRSGDLGFVYADGRTAVPQVRVDPAVYRAADAVEDGQIVVEPVAVDDRFAIVWRRGTRPEIANSLSEVAPAIERALRHEDFSRARDRLIDELRTTHLSEHHPGRLDGIAFDPVTVIPPALPPPPKAVSPTPSGSTSAGPVRTQRGLR